MAGFFGLFDYNKPGKGVRKDEPQKGRFAHFWELFFRKFWRLCQLNLLFVVACVPVVFLGWLLANYVHPLLSLPVVILFGPLISALVYVLRNMATEQPVFMTSDFLDALKSNWKQSLAYTAIVAAFGGILSFAGSFYFQNAERSSFLIVPACLCIFMGFMAIGCTLYSYLMIVTLDLPLKSIVKNGLILTILCLKTNLLTMLFCGILLLASYLFFPISAIVYIFLGFALLGFIICYNSYPGIQKYAIDPYIEKMDQASRETGGEEETVFQDEQLIPEDKETR